MPFVDSVSNPYCECEFHTESRLYSAIGMFNPTDDLLSVDTQKSLEAPAGSFSIQLLGHEWYKRLKPQDLVVIKMGRPPERLDTVMVGLIDDIRKNRSVGENGAVRRVTNVQGRDFGKIFLKAFIQFFPQFDESDFPKELTEFEKTFGNAMSALLGMRKLYLDSNFSIGSPASLIHNIMNQILKAVMNFQVTYYGKASDTHTAQLSDILRYRLAKTDFIHPFFLTTDSFEGALWNLFTSAQNAPFNELFIDIRTDYMEVVPESVREYDSRAFGNFQATFGDDDAKVCLFLRKTPFDKADWEALKTHTIKDVDIIDEDLGVSDHENYNMFLAKPALTLIGETNYNNVVKPKFNAFNMIKHGIQYLEIPVNGLIVEEGDAQIPDTVAGTQLTEKLKSWFENNINYESGTLIVKGNGQYKIGQRIKNEDTDMVYYIEAVNQSFVNCDSWKTTLSVTRGQSATPTQTAQTPAPAPVATPTPAPVAQPVAPVEKPVATNSISYKVKSGDTLYKIAYKYYKNANDGISKIMAVNPQIKDKNLIYVGQVITIPNPEKGV